jgi:hypothetical protein
MRNISCTHRVCKSLRTRLPNCSVKNRSLEDSALAHLGFGRGVFVCPSVVDVSADVSCGVVQGTSHVRTTGVVRFDGQSIQYPWSMIHELLEGPMTGESLLFRCDNCKVRIAITSGVRNTGAPKERRYQDSEKPNPASVHEGLCPKCNAPFEIWSDPPILTTHSIDLEVHRPDVFIGDAKERVDQLRAGRTEQQAKREESQKRSEERRRIRDEERQAKAEAKQVAIEEQRKATIAARSADDGDEGDWDDDDGGRSPNDDRSDSMNPNNDAYGASRR